MYNDDDACDEERVVYFGKLFHVFSVCCCTLWMPRRMKTIILITGQTLPNKNLFYNDRQRSIAASWRETWKHRRAARILSWLFWYFNVGQWSALSCLEYLLHADSSRSIMNTFFRKVLCSFLDGSLVAVCAEWKKENMKNDSMKGESFYEFSSFISSHTQKKTFIFLLKKSIDSLDTCRR